MRMNVKRRCVCWLTSQQGRKGSCGRKGLSSTQQGRKGHMKISGMTSHPPPSFWPDCGVRSMEAVCNTAVNQHKPTQSQSQSRKPYWGCLYRHHTGSRISLSNIQQVRKWFQRLLPFEGWLTSLWDSTRTKFTRSKINSLQAESIQSPIAYKLLRAQPPGGRCSDWVPTSPAPSPHHTASSQKPSSRDQMTNQLTNQINQMSLNSQAVGQSNNQINPRLVSLWNFLAKSYEMKLPVAVQLR